MGRFTVVDYCTGTIVEDMIIKPTLPVEDCLTTVSGITTAAMERATLTVESVVEWIRRNVGPLTILIAHHAKMDFIAIGFQPHNLVIDTASLFDNPAAPSGQPSLEDLAKWWLHRDLKKERAIEGGHCSAVDSRVCCDLVRLVVERGEYIQRSFSRHSNLSM